MGRAARRRKEPQPIAKPVTLEPPEFWKFRAVVRDAEAIAAQAQEAVNQAVAKRDSYVAELAQKYGFNPKATHWQWNDETYEIAVQ